ncbi:hypothetical protein [Burkholderia ubonensis]|nr:hypothetical protein [Burkholderia ubonensis]
MSANGVARTIAGFVAGLSMLKTTADFTGYSPSPCIAGSKSVFDYDLKPA